jgi:hypothetical protein
MKRMILIGVLVVAMVVGVVAYSYADTASEAVTVSATPRSMLVFTVTTNTVDFGSVDPGVAVTDETVDLQVKSNKIWDFTMERVDDAWEGYVASDFLTETIDGDLAGSSTQAGASVNNNARGVADMTATYSLDMVQDAAWELDGGSTYSDTFTYTVTQQP